MKKWDFSHGENFVEWDKKSIKVVEIISLAFVRHLPTWVSLSVFRRVSTPGFCGRAEPAVLFIQEHVQ